MEFPDFSEFTDSSFIKNIAELSFNRINDISGIWQYFKNYLNDYNDINKMMFYFENPIFFKLKKTFENNNWHNVYDGLNLVGSNAPNELHPYHLLALFKLYGEIANKYYDNNKKNEIINIKI